MSLSSEDLGKRVPPQVSSVLIASEYFGKRGPQVSSVLTVTFLSGALLVYYYHHHHALVPISVGASPSSAASPTLVRHRQSPWTPSPPSPSCDGKGPIAVRCDSESRVIYVCFKCCSTAVVLFVLSIHSLRLRDMWGLLIVSCYAFLTIIKFIGTAPSVWNIEG